MKILHITQFFHPDKGYQENSVSHEQRKDGHQVSIITSDDVHYWASTPEQVSAVFGQDELLTKNAGIDIYRIKTKRLISGRIIPEGFFSFVKKADPDVVFLHGVATPMSILAMRYLKKLGKKDIKIIVDDHMVDAGSFNKNSSKFYALFKRFYSVFLKMSAPKVNKWVGVSAETVEFMKRNYGIKEKIEMIPLGFNAESCYRDEAGAQEWMQRNNLPLNKKYILYIGKIDQFKKPEDLIAPAAEFIKENPQYALLMVGEGTKEHLSKLKSLAEQSGILDSLYICPPVTNSDIRKVFSAAEVAVWPHGSSMAMLEAMKCGCPVVAGDLDVNKERLDNGRGIMFRKDDFEDLYLKLKSVASEKESIIESAQAWVQDYTWENINKAFLKF